MTDDKKNIENTILEERRQKLEQPDKGDAYSNSFKPKNTAKAIIESLWREDKG